MQKQITTETSQYKRNQSIVFRKTQEAYGRLSNMCEGFVIRIGGYSFLTSEAHYQAFRFKDDEIQQMIMNERSPISAKIKSKKYRSRTRKDWDEIRVEIMEFCLLIKLGCNWDSFSTLLLSTGDKEIVEESHKDGFWGAVSDKSGVLIGKNVLGETAD